MYYGGYVFADNAETTIVTGGTFVKAVNATRGTPCNGFSHSANRLTCNVSGVIEVIAAFSMTTDAADTAELAIFRNGIVVDDDAAVFRKTSINDEGAGCVVLPMHVVKGDYVEVWVTTSGGAEVAVTGGTVTAKVIS